MDNIKKDIRKKKLVEEILSKHDIQLYELLGIIELMKQDGELIDYVKGEIVKLSKPPKINDVYEIPHNLEKLKLLLISDTHLCSKYDRLDILRYLYTKCDDLGIKHVLHSGDFVDGRSNRAEHIYELKEVSYNGQVDYCIEKYPHFNGITYAISGNHDDWWYKSTGNEIVKDIADKREDIIYLGQNIADLKIGKLKTRLFHGFGGASYAKSYKIQKYLDSISANEKPDIFQTGHIHSSFYYKQDKTHCFQTASLEDQTPYARSLGLGNDKGCWWVDIDFDDKGNIYQVTPTLETFDKKLVRKK